MRLLLYNPNSNTALTERLAQAVVPFLRPHDSLAVATAREVAPFIGSDQTIAAARGALLNQLTPIAQDVDAVLLGCFGDLGIEQVRRTIGRPLLSLWDACATAADLSGKRLGIVTTSSFWVERLTENVRDRGLSEVITTVLPIRDFEGSTEELEKVTCASIRMMAGTGIDEVVLGGALLAVLRSQIAQVCPLPIFNLLDVAVGLCRALAPGSEPSA